MENVKQQIVERLKQANNILVTVKNDPSIDLLSACIGLALVLGKLEKHAAAVFSGQVPSAMEFLKPEETLEPTTNSLRDFIISLDKSKADKLRYKVEDKVVRIFITPYRTSLSESDLEFSQGDFNIDVVVALGVREQAELDAAVTAHGRILHDATVVSINNFADGNLGSLNWNDTNASSVSEMVTDLARMLGPEMLDGQIATALLTGVVAETQRFSNDKTTPQTMRVAGELMAAGANQQLVANELQGNAKEVPHANVEADKPAGDNGTLDIKHTEPELESKVEAKQEQSIEEPEPTEPAPEEPSKPEGVPAREILPMPEPGSSSEAHGSDAGEDVFTAAADGESPKSRSYLIDQPPVKDTQPSEFTPPNPFSGPDGAPQMPLLKHNQPAPSPAIQPDATPAEPVAVTQTDDIHKGQTLEEIEASVGAHDDAESTPSAPAPIATVDDARSRVLQALNEGPQPLSREPIKALNANPFGPPIPHEEEAPTSSPAPSEPARPIAIEVDDEGNLKPAPPTDKQPLDMPLPPVAPIPSMPPQQASAAGTPPPPEPPPLMPPSFMGPAQ